jgi:hypothetical protein
MEKKQSSIDWFYQRILAKDIESVFEQAKAMHKEETEQFGAVCCLKTTQKNQWSLEQLYNETFGGQE